MSTQPVTFKDAWGFTKLDVFRTCKQKFEFQFIKKLPQKGSPAMERGAKLHENIEGYLNGWIPNLLPELEEWTEALDALRQKDFHGEQAIGIDKNWVLLPDWFDKTTWLRVKMDAYYTEDMDVTCIDFKSGQFRIPSTDQIELYAVSALSIKPDLENATAEFWFLDTNQTHKVKYTRQALIDLRVKYENESAPMYTTEVWTPEPSNECRWCPYSKTKKGPCKY